MDLSLLMVDLRLLVFLLHLVRGRNAGVSLRILKLPQRAPMPSGASMPLGKISTIPKVSSYLPPGTWCFGLETNRGWLSGQTRRWLIGIITFLSRLYLPVCFILMIKDLGFDDATLLFAFLHLLCPSFEPCRLRWFTQKCHTSRLPFRRSPRSNRATAWRSCGCLSGPFALDLWACPFPRGSSLVVVVDIADVVCYGSFRSA